jgi:Zn-dependent protease
LFTFFLVNIILICDIFHKYVASPFGQSAATGVDGLGAPAAASAPFGGFGAPASTAPDKVSYCDDIYSS